MLVALLRHGMPDTQLDRIVGPGLGQLRLIHNVSNVLAIDVIDGLRDDPGIASRKLQNLSALRVSVSCARVGSESLLPMCVCPAADPRPFAVSSQTVLYGEGLSRRKGLRP